MYVKTNWKDRIVQNPLTYEIINNEDGSITLVPKPGEIVQGGTPVHSAFLNNLEEGVSDVINLHSENIPGTTCIPTFDTTGDNVTKLEHKVGSTVIRTDVFTYLPTLITETRTLATGESVRFEYTFATEGKFVKTEVI